MRPASLPPTLLAFTWRWDHLPDAPDRVVVVGLEPSPEGGTDLTITHGPFEDSEEGRSVRKDHLEGWQHAIGRLRSLPTP